MASFGVTLFPRGIEGPTALVRLAADLEDRGVDNLFMVEGGNEALTFLAGLASATSTATIGSAIANIYLRHPLEIAQAAANIDDFSESRFVLGLGTAHQIVNVKQLGFDMSRPLARMRDYVRCVRAALDSAGRTIEVATEHYQIKGARIAWSPKRRVPILLAALSDGMVRLAARQADGVITSLATLPQLRHIRQTLDETARQVGRDPRDLRVYAVINTVVRDDRSAARDVIRPTISIYGKMPFYERELSRNGLMVGDGATDDLIDALAIAGPSAYARERLEQYREAGVDVPLLAIGGAEPDASSAYRSLASLKN